MHAGAICAAVYHGVLPPQFDHTEEQLAQLDTGSAWQWFWRAITGRLDEARPEPKRAAIAYVARAGKVLAIRRADNGLLGAPGGRCEPGEDSAATVARELREETGCEALAIRFLSEGPGIRGFYTYRFVVEIAEDAEPIAVEPGTEVLWVEPEELARGFGAEFHRPALVAAGFLRANTEDEI